MTHDEALRSVDPRLLSRPGQVLRILSLWFDRYAHERRPSVDQLAAFGNSNRRTIQRGLKELAAWKMIALIPDPSSHPVGRAIEIVDRPDPKLGDPGPRAPGVP